MSRNLAFSKVFANSKLIQIKIRSASYVTLKLFLMSLVPDVLPARERDILPPHVF